MNYDKKRYYVRECKEKENGKIGFHTSTTIEYETPQKNAPEEKETRREYYLFSKLFGYLTTIEDTWFIDSGTCLDIVAPSLTKRIKGSHAWQSWGTTQPIRSKELDPPPSN